MGFNSFAEMRFLRKLSEKAASLFMSFGYKETTIANIVPFDYIGAGNIKFFSPDGIPLAMLGNIEAFFEHDDEESIMPQRYFFDQELYNFCDGELDVSRYMIGSFRQGNYIEGVEEFLAISYKVFLKMGFNDIDIYRSNDLDMDESPKYFGVKKPLLLKELPETVLFAIQRKGISLATCIKREDNSVILILNISEALLMKNAEKLRDTNLLIYEGKRAFDAKELSESLRITGQKSILLKKDDDVSIESYLAFCKHEPVDILMYLMDSGKVLLYNLITGDRKIIHDSL